MFKIGFSVVTSVATCISMAPRYTRLYCPGTARVSSRFRCFNLLLFRSGRGERQVSWEWEKPVSSLGT